MKTYLKNGMCSDVDFFPDEMSDFCIQELRIHGVEKYIYKGDSTARELDDELVLLYDKFRDLYFKDTDDYYKQVTLLPVFVQEAGYDSDSCLHSEMFRELINQQAVNNPDFYKHLYLVDCQFLIATIQNLVIAMDYFLTSYYVKLSEIELKNNVNDKSDTVLFVSSRDTIQLSSVLESYFTKAYSILDMITKIVYELENKHEAINSHKKLQSHNLLWGDRKRLSIKNQEGTIFIRSDTTKMIEALRNEVVHNGSWEQNPKTFIVFKNNEIAEKFMLFPDFNDGILATVKGRNHFFGNGVKVNEILPEIHLNYLSEILSTVKFLNEKYQKNE